MVHYHSQVEYTILDVKIQGGFLKMNFTVEEIKMILDITITWLFWIIVHLIFLLSVLVTIRLFLGVSIPKKLVELMNK